MQINAHRHPNVRSLPIVHLANANSHFYSYYMMYTVVEKYGATLKEEFFRVLELLSYSDHKGRTKTICGSPHGE